jgi:anti-sigma regulatory factor (Ser/Thr protein kinase)
MEFRFPPDHGHLRTLRKEVRTGLQGSGVSRARIDMVLLVLDEIVSNSIEHAREYRSTGELRVRIEARAQGVLVEFEDPDVPETTVADLARVCRGRRDAVPAAHNERGRGLFLLADSVEDLVIAPAPGGGLSLRGRVAKDLA